MLDRFEYLGCTIVRFKTSKAISATRVVNGSAGMAALLENGKVAYSRNDVFKYGLYGSKYNLALADALFALGKITKEQRDGEHAKWEEDQKKRDLRSSAADLLWSAKATGIKLTPAQIKRCAQLGAKPNA